MDYNVLFQHYRTIAYERVNPGGVEGFEEAIRTTDPTYGRLLPADLEARILDVGCGMGHLLYYLKAKGYHNIMGVDVSPEQVAYCQEFVLPQAQLTPDLISFLGERPSHWDCIVMKDVIEHLPRKEIIPTLAAVHDALAKGATLLIETGNMASATGLFVRYIDFTHECGFTENSLRQVLRAVGFTEIQVMSPSPVIYSWRSRLRVLAQRLWEWCVRMVYRLELGWDAAPRVLSNLLIACARKTGP
jgi:SAM-dependent methyltransferase